MQNQGNLIKEENTDGSDIIQILESFFSALNKLKERDDKILEKYQTLEEQLEKLEEISEKFHKLNFVKMLVKELSDLFGKEIKQFFSKTSELDIIEKQKQVKFIARLKKSKKFKKFKEKFVDKVKVSVSKFLEHNKPLSIEPQSPSTTSIASSSELEKLIQYDPNDQFDEYSKDVVKIFSENMSIKNSLSIRLSAIEEFEQMNVSDLLFNDGWKFFLKQLCIAFGDPYPKISDKVFQLHVNLYKYAPPEQAMDIYISVVNHLVWIFESNSVKSFSKKMDKDNTIFCSTIKKVKMLATFQRDLKKWWLSYYDTVIKMYFEKTLHLLCLKIPAKFTKTSKRLILNFPLVYVCLIDIDAKWFLQLIKDSKIRSKWLTNNCIGFYSVLSKIISFSSKVHDNLGEKREEKKFKLFKINVRILYLLLVHSTSIMCRVLTFNETKGVLSSSKRSKIVHQIIDHFLNYFFNNSTFLAFNEKCYIKFFKIFNTSIIDALSFSKSLFINQINLKNLTKPLSYILKEGRYKSREKVGSMSGAAKNKRDEFFNLYFSNPKKKKSEKNEINHLTIVTIMNILNCLVKNVKYLNLFVNTIFGEQKISSVDGNKTVSVRKKLFSASSEFKVVVSFCMFIIINENKIKDKVVIEKCLKLLKNMLKINQLSLIIMKYVVKRGILTQLLSRLSEKKGVSKGKSMKKTYFKEFLVKVFRNFHLSVNGALCLKNENKLNTLILRYYFQNFNSFLKRDFLRKLSNIFLCSYYSERNEGGLKKDLFEVYLVKIFNDWKVQKIFSAKWIPEEHKYTPVFNSDVFYFLSLNISFFSDSNTTVLDVLINGFVFSFSEKDEINEWKKKEMDQFNSDVYQKIGLKVVMLNINNMECLLYLMRRYKFLKRLKEIKRDFIDQGEILRRELVDIIERLYFTKFKCIENKDMKSFLLKEIKVKVKKGINKILVDSFKYQSIAFNRNEKGKEMKIEDISLLKVFQKDVFVGIITLLFGNVKEANIFLKSFFLIEDSIFIWKERGRDVLIKDGNGGKKRLEPILIINQIVEMILHNEYPSCFSFFVMQGINPSIIVSKWMSQFFLNYLEMEEIFQIFFTIFSKGIDYLVYIIIACLIHVRKISLKKVEVIDELPCVKNWMALLKRIDGFENKNYLPICKEMEKKYRNFCSKKMNLKK